MVLPGGIALICRFCKQLTALASSFVNPPVPSAYFSPNSTMVFASFVCNGAGLSSPICAVGGVCAQPANKLICSRAHRAMEYVFVGMIICMYLSLERGPMSILVKRIRALLFCSLTLPSRQRFFRPGMVLSCGLLI